MSEIIKTSDNALSYLLNEHGSIELPRGGKLPLDPIKQAIDLSHATLKTLGQLDIDIFTLLGMRNLSALVGEVFCASLIKGTGNLFRKNPHQDGYPDLLLMDERGAAEWTRLKLRLREKTPFSPFPTGGIEIKATCGTVPTPAQMAKVGGHKPGIGDQRVALLQGYDWKAHHRETNCLMGLFWDFVAKMPTIVTVFYSASLKEEDWGKIIQPTEGGGRTTSVSIMQRSGIRKMFSNWIAVLSDERYIRFFERVNKGAMRRS